MSVQVVPVPTDVKINQHAYLKIIVLTLLLAAILRKHCQPSRHPLPPSALSDHCHHHGYQCHGNTRSSLGSQHAPFMQCDQRYMTSIANA